MEKGLLPSLVEGSQSLKDLYRSWRKCYREDSSEGTLKTLQLCVDLTGYSYVFKPEDLENVGNMLKIVREKIVKSNYREVDLFSKRPVLKHLYELLELMIAHDRQELLQNNIWLNSLIRLLVAFCEVNDDECKMVAGYLSTLILVHLSIVQQYVEKELVKSQHEEDSGELPEAEKRGRYVHKISKLLIRNIEAGCGYATTLPMIAEMFCRLLEVYPTMYVLEHCKLNVLATLLQHRHSKMFGTVANCFKNLLNPDMQPPEVINAVAVFFEETAGKKFIQAMLNYKSSEKFAMEVIVSVQRRNYGQSIFDEDITEKLRQYMFHGDEIVRGYAIDFHVCTLCHPEETESNNSDILRHILTIYVRYDHGVEALRSLIADLWQLEFFDDWGMLFDLLVAESARENNFFMVISIVHVVNQCHALLMRDLERSNRTNQHKTSRSQLRSLLKSFMVNYPEALRRCASNEQAYLQLLQPAHASNHEKYVQLNANNIDTYYEALFAVLEMVAKSATDFYTVQQNLLVIRSYWRVILDVEQMWSELQVQYSNEFIETRMKFTSRNIGKDSQLTTKYVTCLTRLTALLELDYKLVSQLPDLIKILINDFRLLDKMNLDSYQTSMFYRIYKCAFYAVVHGLQSGMNASTLEMSGRRLKKRVMELLRVLIKQLYKYDESLDTSVHMFISLCDMLLTTQVGIADSDIPELQEIGYPVEPALLERMAKFLLNYLFSKQYDWHETPVVKQKQMLTKYIDLYQLHKSLPRIVDTHYIVANFSVQTPFEKQIKHLMTVLYQVHPTLFGEVISQAAFQLLLVYKSESSVKAFFKKFRSFALTHLTIDNGEQYSIVITDVVEKVLDYMMDVALQSDGDQKPTRMLKLIEPLLLQVSVEERANMERLLLDNPGYEHLTESDLKAITRFVQHLKK